MMADTTLIPEQNESRQPLQELLQSATRHLIFVLGALWIVWHFLTPLNVPVSALRDVWAITALVLATSLFAIWGLPRYQSLAQLCWLAGMTTGLTLVIYRFGQSELAFLYALIPLITIVILDWKMALVSEAIIVVLVWAIGSNMFGAQSADIQRGPVLLTTLVTLSIGWILTRSLFNLTEWYIFSFVQAQQKVREARQHRAQVLQLFKELDQAYYRLNRANAALVAARKTAEETERFKTEFVTNVSHELRTPLNLIVGFTEMMITSPESYDGVQLPGAYRSDINAVNHSARHLLTLVDDVLDLARIEVGKLAVMREAIDFAAFIDETVAIVRDYIAAKGLELRIELAPELPTLWVDRLRIRQVLLNLLVNAARHTKEGYIEVNVGHHDDEIVVQVIDTGAGIPEHEIGYLFEEFSTTEQSSSDWHSGTGLGLPISKKFVELHRGRMGVESAYGKGATFWFTLPTAPINLDTVAIPFPRRQSSTVVHLGASERIVVVVDEDTQTTGLLRRYLDGYKVIGVEDCEDGIQLVEEIKALALIIPQSSAHVAEASEALTIRMPLPNARTAANHFGVYGLLGKPVARRDLVAALTRLPTMPARVLVVDDDPDVGRLFSRMLRPQPGVGEVLAACNGEEALRLMREKRPDLVLLDLVMPDMDGETLLKIMSTDGNLQQIPVILISAKAHDYHQKPLEGAIEIMREGGFELGEVVKTLEATLNALSPGWGSLDTTVPKPASNLAD